jgi:PleD family two-component response regulator
MAAAHSFSFACRQDKNFRSGLRPGNDAFAANRRRVSGSTRHGTKVHYHRPVGTLGLPLLKTSRATRASWAAFMTSTIEPAAESICLLDDDPAVLKSISRLLACDGFAVRAFSEPKNFLAYLQEHCVRLVILDIWMEGMDGLEIQTKVSEISAQTRVIIITGDVDPVTKNAALNAGAIAFFMKPFDDEEFLTAVRNAIANPAP